MALYYILPRFIFNKIILKYPVAVIIFMLALAVLAGFGIRHFTLESSAETLILQNDKDLLYTRLIGSRYGEHDTLMLIFTPKDDLFSKQTLSVIENLQNDLKSHQDILSVTSILDVPLFGSSLVSVKQLAGGLPNLSSGKVDPNSARKEFQDSPLYQNLLVSPDLKTTALLIAFRDDAVYDKLASQRDELQVKNNAGTLTQTENAKLKNVIEQINIHNNEMRIRRHQDISDIRSIMDKYRHEGQLFLGGISMIADDMITFIRNDLKVFGTGMLLFLILTLGIIFRRKRWVLFPMLSCALSVIYMMGLLGWLGWKVTVVSANFISLQLITTVAIVIYLIVRYRELLVENPQESNRELISNTVLSMIRPCWFTTITTIAGFGSLVLCNILPVIMFGWMMMLSLLVSFTVSFLFFPAFLVLIPKEKLPDIKQSRFALTSVLAKFNVNHREFIIFVSIFILTSSLIGMTKLRVENSFIDYFHKSTEIYKGMKVIDQKLGGTTPLDVLIDFNSPEENMAADKSDLESDDETFDEFAEFENAANEEKYWFTTDKMDSIKSVQKYLDSFKETGKVMSLATILNIAENLNDGKPLDNFELALLYTKTPDEIKNILVKPYVSVENNQARFWIRIKDSQKGLRRNKLLNDIRGGLTKKLGLDPKNIHLAGVLVLYNNMLQSLFGSQIVTLGITMLILMVMFLLLFKSLKIAFIAMVPNVFPVSVVLGVMGWLNIPLDIMTITIASISMGIAVDTTIHYIHRFRHEFQQYGSYTYSMKLCHESIGRAMYYTSMTIIIGFSILALSNFIPSVHFGLLTALVMFIAILSALTLLPQLLMWLKPFGPSSNNRGKKNKIFKKLKPDAHCLKIFFMEKISSNNLKNISGSITFLTKEKICFRNFFLFLSTSDSSFSKFLFYVIRLTKRAAAMARSSFGPQPKTDNFNRIH